MELDADVRIAGAAADERRPEPKARRPAAALARPVHVVNGKLETLEPNRSAEWVSQGQPGRAFGGSPLAPGQVVFDKERRLGRPEERRPRELPPDDGPVIAPPFSADRLAEIRTENPESRHVGPHGVGGDRPGREPTALLERLQRWSPQPRSLRERPLEYPN